MGGTPAADWEAAEGRDTDPDLTDDDALAASQRIEPELPWSGLLGQPRNVVVLTGGGVAAAIVWLLSGDAGNAFWSGLIAAFLVGVAGHRLAIVVLVRPGVRRVSAGSGLAARGPGGRRRALELAATRGAGGEARRG